MTTAGEQLAAACSFEFSTLEQRLGQGGAVIVAPHPDDESLGCGGLIAEARAQGRPVRVVIVSDGTESHPSSKTHPKDRLRELREEEAKKAVSELGLDPHRDIVFLRLPDRFVPSTGAFAEFAIGEIAGVLEKIGAQALFVTWRHDPHCDHKACYELACGVQRLTPSLSVYEYTIWGATLPPETPIETAQNGFRIPIERQLDRKRRAIAAHRSQMTDLINDDPDGFRMTPSDLARFDLPYEAFFESVG